MSVIQETTGTDVLAASSICPFDLFGFLSLLCSLNTVIKKSWKITGPLPLPDG